MVFLISSGERDRGRGEDDSSEFLGLSSGNVSVLLGIDDLHGNGPFFMFSVSK